MRALICRWLRIKMQHFYYFLLHTTVLLHLQDCMKFACQLDLCVARGLGYHDRVDSFAISRVSRQTTVNKKKKIMPRRTDPRAADRLPAYAIQDKAIRAGSPACEQSPTGPICRKGESRRRS